MNKADKLTFILYSRSYCHLCEDMLNELMLLKPNYKFEIEIVDVDLDDDLVAKYDEMVPVLMAKAGAKENVYLCHHRFDRELVRTYIASLDKRT